MMTPEEIMDEDFAKKVYNLVTTNEYGGVENTNKILDLFKAQLAKCQDDPISMYKKGLTPLIKDASEVTGILPECQKQDPDREKMKPISIKNQYSDFYDWYQRLRNGQIDADTLFQWVTEALIGDKKVTPDPELREKINGLIRHAILDYNQDPNPECAFDYYVPSITDQIQKLYGDVRKQERERIRRELRQFAYERADGNHTLHEYDITDFADKLVKGE